MSKILVTSAYPELTVLVEELAKQLKIELNVIEAVLEEAVAEVGHYLETSNPEVIVSRGATAELLRQNVSLPIVTLAPSEFDIFQALAKALTVSRQIGYLNHPSLNDQGFLSQVRSMLGQEIKYYPYRTMNELSLQMEKAHHDGCEVVVGGGHWGLRLANAFGMVGILIYSSRSTVAGALVQAKELAEFRQVKKREEEHQRKASAAKGLVAHFSFRDLVGSALKDTIAKAKRFSQVEATVLIWGESGTGKELFAQSIHADGPRRNGPFVPLNCVAVPESLLESELFGYHEGAFTGAKKGGKIGLFELANGGTLFLDEIGKMSLNLQAGLLRVLQTKEVRRLGGDRVIPVDVRIIAASNEDLQAAVDAGQFRSDLYYRLNVLNLYLPSLRQRQQDIADLIESILEKLAVKLGYRPVLAKEFAQAIKDYHWPGNVRQLENVLERYAVLVGEGEPLERSELLISFPELRDLLDGSEPVNGIPESTIKPSDLAICSLTNSPSKPINDVFESKMICQRSSISTCENEQIQDLVVGEDIIIRLGTLEDMELQLIDAVMHRCRGNKSSAVSLLKISRTTLWKKLSLKS
ncbi:sigma-54-dependent Fis family transcriptional regulator [Desulfosporosinus sp. BICA1-9]|uniref:sigma-54-dependent Fis family transcriptional regulator n=1 Tax=Desulfosporosinus sp. BICA1-9 TaxID=1531958 RepID=UPI00054B8A83|nr:sigma-54-dependent Fis family transcriptional regulator [Desulfosporosinus sp. BICA1-9]KJS46952.1 MAG: RNA polymerase subunit sigma-54 [Peptococcaceae bacterium BRH_c23]KJS87636.1 MAG: RNA polymerase subunit sigma-54 [Desulfosporosinus sp. BICA1-9]HBW33837.1 propionate catabolism operon regulatory protein PrpR [Desulfosporosinus sp.]